MLDTWEFRAILKNEKALNPLRLKASEMAPPVGLEPTTLRLTAACSTDWANEEYIGLAQIMLTHFVEIP